MRTTTMIALLVCLLAGCQQDTEQTDAVVAIDETAALTVPATAQFGSWGVDLENRDLAIRPGDDFYGYANGHWLETYELPPDKTGFGSFLALHEQAQERVRGLLMELAAANPEPGSVEQKVGDYYDSFLDVATINSRGLSPIADELAAIAGGKGGGKPDMARGAAPERDKLSELEAQAKVKLV